MLSAPLRADMNMKYQMSAPIQIAGGELELFSWDAFVNRPVQLVASNQTESVGWPFYESSLQPRQLQVGRRKVEGREKREEGRESAPV